MHKKPRVLFACGSNSCRSQMAEGFLRAQSGDRVDVESAGVTSSEVHAKAIEVMREIGIDISHHTSKSVADLGSTDFDLVITLCDEAKEACINPRTFGTRGDGDASSEDKVGVLAGAPAHLHWPVPDPAVAEGDEEEVLAAFRSSRDQVGEHIRVLEEHGYLQALATQRERLTKMADLLESGIIAHDDGRRIYLFNRAAEQITGRSREEVLGMDCHQAFPPDGLCGSQCRFKRRPKVAPEKQEYEGLFTTQDGVEKRLKMRVAPMDMAEGCPGVLAVVRDVTEVSDLRRKLDRSRSFHGIVGISAAVQEIFETIRSVSSSDYSVLISGESGTGKELVASAIHQESRRKGNPFVPVSCGALPESILESELFGHVRGAFTGAIRDKKGRFELADGGTLFLDEVGELPPSFQVKLLRVLQEMRFERVGGEKSISVDVRIIAASNRDIRKMVQDGDFREDLFYRLCVVPIVLPPLRARREDIPFLVERILERVREETGKPISSVANEAMDLLLDYSWPGNIRELINALQFAAVRCRGEEILPLHLPPEVSRAIPAAPAAAVVPKPNAAETPSRRRAKLTREAVEEAIAAANGNKVQAAKILGVGRATLYRFLSAEQESRSGQARSKEG